LLPFHSIAILELAFQFKSFQSRHDVEDISQWDPRREGDIRHSDVGKNVCAVKKSLPKSVKEWLSGHRQVQMSDANIRVSEK
jgi:hypothetical protein